MPAAPVSGQAPRALLRTRVNDLVIGAVVIALGLYMLAKGLGMPKMNKDGALGSGLFPVVIGGALAFFGVLLLGQVVLQTLVLPRLRTAAVAPAPAQAAPTPEASPATPAAVEAATAPAEDTAAAVSDEIIVEVVPEPGWRLLANGATVALGVAFYLLASDWLGFHITMFLILLAVQLVLGGKKLTSVLVAIGVPFLLWGVFEKLLLVQLPNGILGI